MFKCVNLYWIFKFKPREREESLFSLLFSVQLIHVGGNGYPDVGGNDYPDVEDKPSGTRFFLGVSRDVGSMLFSFRIFFIHCQLWNGTSTQEVCIS